MSKTPQELVAEAKEIVPTISCDEYKTLRASEEPHTLIDVREQNEWDAGHIEGATHIPRGLLEFKIGEVVPEKAALIIVQCKTGGRGALCGEALLKLGYQNVKNLDGGYEGYCKI